MTQIQIVFIHEFIFLIALYFISSFIKIKEIKILKIVNFSHRKLDQ